VRGSDKVQISPPERCVHVGHGVKPRQKILVCPKIWGGGNIWLRISKNEKCWMNKNRDAMTRHVTNAISYRRARKNPFEWPGFNLRLT
jgi:hypothetical protein